MTFLDALNTVLWVWSNVLIAYIAMALIAFRVAYVILFDPKATTAGRVIAQFTLSLIGVIGLVVLGIFVDPHANTSWWAYPSDIAPWRPAVRFVAYGYVAYTVTSLVVVLWVRKYRPDKIQTAPNENTLNVKVRHDNRGKK